MAKLEMTEKVFLGKFTNSKGGLLLTDEEAMDILGVKSTTTFRELKNSSGIFGVPYGTAGKTYRWNPDSLYRLFLYMINPQK